MRHPEQQPTVIGIDPGLDGAVAILLPSGEIETRVTPTFTTGRGAKREYDVGAMKALLSAAPVTLAGLTQPPEQAGAGNNQHRDGKRNEHQPGPTRARRKRARRPQQPW